MNFSRLRLHLPFSAEIWLFLIGAFGFGMGSAQLQLYLNFYLQALGIGAGMQGLLNALPAWTLVLAGLPAAALARRVSFARTIQLGSALSLLGLLGIALSTQPLTLILFGIVQGVGSTFLMVSTSPFMAAHSRPEERITLFSLQMALMTTAGFLGNLLGGQMPGLYAESFGGTPRDLEAIRSALLAGAALQVVGLLPVLWLRPGAQARGEGAKRRPVQDPRTMWRLLLPNLLVGVGAGLTIPYLNLFVEGKFGVPFAQLGTLFAWTSLATAVTVLIQPALVRRYGELKTILIVQGGSLPFLVMLGFAPSLLLVTAALFIRGALMNAAGPVYSAHAMARLSESDRGTYSALNSMMWNGGWALGSLISGGVRAALEFDAAFDLLFCGTVLLYAASVVAIYLGLYRTANAQNLAALRSGVD
ncbi:MFS family permease [Deinobacterium chartae]|uniref:MFS family permease n=1 Tax=Deinobacterium chartae TaxID=521158 RepID=A0A841HZY9_9DEIO|nr:MFS transporter [Deinobacterium chartae]MBB6097305.1 MFS family permease [Deinobacterium chartae]